MIIVLLRGHLLPVKGLELSTGTRRYENRYSIRACFAQLNYKVSPIS